MIWFTNIEWVDSSYLLILWVILPCIYGLYRLITQSLTSQWLNPGLAALRQALVHAKVEKTHGVSAEDVEVGHGGGDFFWSTQRVDVTFYSNPQKDWSKG